MKLDIGPIVKWAGGKTQLLPQLISLMPKEYKRYYEPFIGGGALLFEVQPAHPHINDMNSELLAVYKCFCDESLFEDFKSKLETYEKLHSEDFYYSIRSLDKSDDWNRNATLSERAARMVYLNKACFNGLYRVNSKGFFNVPSGKKEKLTCFNRSNFEGVFNYFAEAKPIITHGDFEEAVKDVSKGDFVYFDPPYDPWDDKNSFTSYDKDGFGKDEQARLARVAKSLSDRGAFVMLSNHNTKYINQLYEGFNIQVVNARRAINSDPSGRRGVEEVIITNY